MYTPTYVTTVVMFIMTVYLMIGRFRARPDASWPLFYYLFLFAYNVGFPGKLNPGAVYAGVVTALFIRFEFLHQKILVAARAIEMLVLAFLAWRFLQLVGF